MGAFELGDQVGNDVTLHVLDYMHDMLGDAYEPCPLLQQTVADDKLGKKTGVGFYEYEDGPGAEYPPDAGRDDIAIRLLAVMANEVGKLRQKDVAPVSDIDRAVKLGGRFPDGPAKMADKRGLERLVETLETAHEETGHARYEVSEGLRNAAQAGGFHDNDADAGDVAFNTVRIEYPRETVAHLVLDRPQQMNTVTPELLDEFDAALDRIEADDDVRALLVTGEGDRAFCAGANPVAIADVEEPTEGVKLARKGQEAWGYLEELSIPVVAGIDGYTLGGGMEMATCADFRLATERSTFGQPEHNLGILPAWDGTQRLKHLIGESRAKEVIFTCDQYDAETMAEYDFV